MGADESAELWNNVGLCAFYSQQYDIAIPCFENALRYSTDDTTVAEVWYNIGHVAINIGDRELACQCFKLAISANSQHAEALNNLGVIEMQMGLGKDT
ncbi:Tetratricopeptide repeat protein 8, partial [Chytridiales sp. JEL 0842]